MAMDFEKICRLCLEERDRMRPITEGEDTFLRDIFRNILQIEVYPNDQLPQSICPTCITALTKLHSTIELFRANDLKLRNQLYGFVEVKTEIIEEIVEPTALPNPKTEHADQDEDEDLPDAEYLDEEALMDPSDIKSPEYEDLEGYTRSDEQDESSVDITADWKMPMNESDSTDDVPKRKQGRPRVGPAKQRRKGTCGRPRKNFKDPNRPRKNDHKCYVCMSESQGSSEALFVHLMTHTDQLPYTCSECVMETVVINQVTTLNIHKRMHLLPEKCPHCDKRFSGKHTVDLHILMMHQELAPQDDPDPCTTCGKVFLSKKALRFHMHSHNQRIACEICGKMYHSKTKLRVHIKRVHEKTGKAECHICHKMLHSLDAVQSHINVMHTNEKIQCKYCPKTYTSKTSLRLHEKRHETIPEGKEMSNDWKQFYTFVEGNEDLKPSARLKRCNLCGATVMQIGTHLAKRHFPKQFRCEQCETNFSDRKALEVHMLEHSVGKFLKCPICEHEFTERKYLMKHLKTKKHRDHPLAQNTDWLDAKYPSTVPKRVNVETGGAVQEVKVAVESIGSSVGSGAQE